jgi:dTDP-D-glucose 4,6-dehydratase
MDPIEGAHDLEAEMLHLDCELSQNELGWKPVWNSERMLERTVRWYRRQHEQGLLTSQEDLFQFLDDARAQGAVWSSPAD